MGSEREGKIGESEGGEGEGLGEEVSWVREEVKMGERDGILSVQKAEEAPPGGIQAAIVNVTYSVPVSARVCMCVLVRVCVR